MLGCRAETFRTSSHSAASTADTNLGENTPIIRQTNSFLISRVNVSNDDSASRVPLQRARCVRGSSVVRAHPAYARAEAPVYEVSARSDREVGAGGIHGDPEAARAAGDVTAPALRVVYAEGFADTSTLHMTIHRCTLLHPRPGRVLATGVTNRHTHGGR